MKRLLPITAITLTSLAIMAGTVGTDSQRFQSVKTMSSEDTINASNGSSASTGSDSSQKKDTIGELPQPVGPGFTGPTYPLVDGSASTGQQQEEEQGTPMEPIKPDLSKYTHKMMVLGCPFGDNQECMAILRDTQGRLVQKMTMRVRENSSEIVVADTVRTYEYDGNKMIEYMVLPEYDGNDQLQMYPLSRKTTSFYKLSTGHREVTEYARMEGDTYVTNSRVVTVFDDNGRKKSYKSYYVNDGQEELTGELTYSYDVTGGCLARGKYDGYEKYAALTRYDSNGNMTANTEWGTYYEYYFDGQNHYQGYKRFDDFNFDNNTYSRVHDENYFDITEKYNDGRTKTMKRKDGGETRSFSYAMNQETMTITNQNGTETYERFFSYGGELMGKKNNNGKFSSVFLYSTIDADKVLDGVNIINEDANTNFNEVVNWKSKRALLTQTYTRDIWGFQQTGLVMYGIVPLTVLPAQTTDEGVTITVGNAGDKVVLAKDGEIFLLDKGGKKRYSVSTNDITVSSEGGKIIISGWNPILDVLFSKGTRAAVQPDNIDLTTQEYNIYIPENVITVNDEPLTELYLPITLEEEASGVLEVNSSKKGSFNDGRMYNLQGMTVKNPAKGEIIIINGKKVVR